jgi:hypothetical protein
LENHPFASQKALRIDVDVELDRALGFRRRGEPVAQIGREVEAARRERLLTTRHVDFDGMALCRRFALPWP